jgi:deazaflavin-dependent oxidoreductase (nitroreductase family)
MSIYKKLPTIAWRLMKIPMIYYKLGLGPIVGRILLLLTTTGRKSGLKRTTPLQYEVINGEYYLGSARGTKADWYRNILVNPNVEIRVKSLQFQGIARTTTNPAEIVDFLEVRLERHPRMLGAMLRSEGLPSNPKREELEKFAQNSALVIVRPLND